ncbi:glutathione S-transferase family protein [Ramlibacter pallidus]|uniref:Glutathione S-transferase family protein n=1 Tax=Ramlibacter pallidus TaxID=2780087 RepID=A0ABR9S061_9BURK|nr:glutathione S-transferase family protein [Ramlibacter pallidus]MBE7366911.1 glutathione S-transferase family protein [Ramlibacter pallidus]
MLTFWYAPGTCALATHLALEYAGAPYEAKRLDFRKGEQRSPEYLRINPKGRVPALVTERGVLTETTALLQYVAQVFPQAGLAPLDDPFALAKMNAFNGYLASTVHVNHAHKLRGYRWVDEGDEAALAAMMKKVPQTMADSFTLIEEQMFQGPWVLGERLSTSDFYLYTLAGWLEGDGVDVQRFPRVADHMRRAEALPAVQKVVAQHKA